MPATKRTRIKCDRCQMLSINGIACHETGCPNAKKVWRDGEWVSQYKCPECGSLYTEQSDACECCATGTSDEPDAY